MQLQPKRERGRSDRKAAAYASEILRLRGEGYTFEAIREALIDIGVTLSEATLRREVCRRQQAGSRSQTTALPPPAASEPGKVSMPTPAKVTAALTGTSGREIAEAFFNANPSNPLLRAKDKP